MAETATTDTTAACCPTCGGWLILSAEPSQKDKQKLYREAGKHGLDIKHVDSADVRSGALSMCKCEKAVAHA